MGDRITINIDGRDVKANEGEYILNIARENGIFIPAICYLTRCSPTLACRICLVDIDGKRAYACNAKAKDGMVVRTEGEEIAKERKTIMEVYDINHPLACGVCDQSGECELQNYTLAMGVDSQNQSISDTHKPTQDWGLIHYDPSLCIVCERCITVCKDMIGDSALKTVKRNGEPIDAKYKESMPKDSYAIWNKMNKNLIGAVAGDKLDCTFCGECSSVCPVGALVPTHFQYKSNAWELNPIPASCTHCSNTCFIYYDVKHTSIDNPENRIYRVRNEFHYKSLCGAGRFGFDFENRVESKDESAFKRAIERFKDSDTIEFNSFITNEEALILQKLKEKFGYRLVNEDAKKFQDFISNYSLTSGKNLYSANLDDIHSSNFVISIGTLLKSDSPIVRFAMNNSLTINKGAGLYFHPIKDSVIEGFSKNLKSIYHNPLDEECALLLILELFGENLPKDLKEYLNSFRERRVIKTTETIRETIVEKVKDEDGSEKEVKKVVPKKVTKELEIDFSKLLEKIGLDENFYAEFDKLIAKKSKFTLIAGEDLISHPNSQNLAKLLGLIDRYTEFKIFIIPTQTNTLGVSLICNLNEAKGSKTIGYNVDGDFKLSSLGDGDLDMPALNQQEGTFTNSDKRVVPTNVALEFRGYCLNDIANELNLKSKYTIDYTKELPKVKGFKPINFDDLDNFFTNSQEERRGYFLEITEFAPKDEFEKISNREPLNGQIIYLANPVLQFSEATNRASLLKSSAKLYLAKSLLEKLKLNEGDRVLISNNLNSLEVEVEVDSKIDGDIAYLPTFDKSVNSKSLFSGYRFNQVQIKKV